MTARAGRGRPLRFLGAAATGWIGLRVVLLWPHIHTPADVLRVIAPIARTEPVPAAFVARTALPVHRRAHPIAVALRADTAQARRGPDPTKVALALLGLVRYAEAQPVEQAPILPGLPRASSRTPSHEDKISLPSRWSASFWLVARGGAGIAPGTLGGQLGGSQAGARLAYLFDRKRRLAIAARVTTPLGAGVREAALGVEWQPTRLPVRIVAEERFALNGGASGPAIGVVGGFGPIAIPLDFRLEGYGQAGAIHRRDTEAYVDGAVRVSRTLTTIGPARVDVGAGAWGAAQRGAARLDIGPSLGVTVPIGKQPVRLALDWRQRVAGDARPGSGLALTLGTDF